MRGRLGDSLAQRKSAMSERDTEPNVTRLTRGAALLESMFRDALRWHEKAAFAAVIVTSTVLPIKVSYRLYYLLGAMLARNPKHRYAVETMRVFDAQAQKSRRAQ